VDWRESGIVMPHSERRFASHCVGAGDFDWEYEHEHE